MTGKVLRKIFGVVFLASAIVVTQLPARDVTASKSTKTDFQLDGDTLVKYTGTADTVSVPDTVKIIGEEAFADNAQISKLTIPSGVKEISYAAFSGCNNLKSVALPDTVENVGRAAFSNCSSLEKFSFGKGIQKLEDGIFVNCKKLTSVSIGSSDHYICKDGIIYDKDMTTIVEVLMGRTKSDYQMPDTVTKIEPYAFYDCSRLKNITLSNNLKEIPAFSFSNCNGLTDIVIPYSVETIDTKAFENCINLEDVTIPESVYSISDSAFAGCPKLNVIAKNGSYPYNWFLTFDRSNVSIIDSEDNEPVSNEDKPKDETSTNKPASDVSGNDVIKPYYHDPDALAETKIVGRKAVFFIDNTIQRVSDVQNSGSTYVTDYSTIADDYSDFLQTETKGKGLYLPKFSIIDNRIANKAYYGDLSLTSFEIPSEITSLGDFSFARSNVSSIVIPEGVTHIGYGAFYHCDNLSEISVPNTVTDIEAYAFHETKMMKNWLKYGGDDFLIMGDGILVSYKGSASIVHIPDSVKVIGPEVFKDHKGITDVYLPENLVRICEEAFMGCANLKYLSGGMYLKTIEDRAFAGCPIETARIVSSVEEIGAGAFDYGSASIEDKYKVAVFHGQKLPRVTINKTSSRLSNSLYRKCAFEDVKVAIVNSEDVSLDGTVLDSNVSGFRGLICVIDNKHDEYSNGTLKIIGSTLSSEDAKSFKVPHTMIIYGKGYNFNDEVVNDVLDSLINEDEPNDNYGEETPSDNLTSEDNGVSTVSFDGSDDRFNLSITNDEGANVNVLSAYKRIYGNNVPANFMTFTISLKDMNGFDITKFGKQKLPVKVLLPMNMSSKNLHVICTDEDGQLEDLAYEVAIEDDKLFVFFDITHTGNYGMYAFDSSSLPGVELDESPETGDFSIEPKWILALGLLCASLCMFIYRPR